MPVTTAYYILCFSSSFESKVIFTILEEEIMNFSVTFVMIIKIVALKPATAAAGSGNRLELGSTLTHSEFTFDPLKRCCLSTY